MKSKVSAGLFMLLLLMLIACSSEIERLFEGKWSLTHTAIGGSPSSFWFKPSGIVVAPWEEYNFAMQSEGTYDFIDDTHLKLNMYKGYYKGNTYIFEVIKLDADELTLGGEYEVLHLKRTGEEVVQ